MASIRLPSSPSSLYNHRRNFSATPLSLQSSSLSWSICNSACYSRPLTISTNKASLFVLRFSSTVQEHTIQELEPERAENEEKEVEYSTTRVVAQYIPWTSTAEDIRRLFEKFGTVVDVELAMYNKTRNRGLAFVEMGSPEEALAAINNLQAYEYEGRKLKMNYAIVKKKKSEPPAPANRGPTFNLFVANLHYEARAKDLREFFRAEGADAVSAEIIFHDNPRRSSRYGFVAFRSKKEADEALTAFQGKLFKGRVLRVARSRQFVRQKPKEGVESDENPTESSSSPVETETADVN